MKVAASRPKALQACDIALAIPGMDGDRTQRALMRIDSALARLEAAASRPAPASDSPGDAELAVRHAELRQAVTVALGTLDVMIAKQKA